MDADVGMDMVEVEGEVEGVDMDVDVRVDMDEGVDMVEGVDAEVGVDMDEVEGAVRMARLGPGAPDGDPDGTD
jgi:hypothetical protein